MHLKIPALQCRGHSLTARKAAPPSYSKMATRGPKIANRVWKSFYPEVFGHSHQLTLNKFFDPSTPSIRKGRDGGEKKKQERVALQERKEAIFLQEIASFK